MTKSSEIVLLRIQLLTSTLSNYSIRYGTLQTELFGTSPCSKFWNFEQGEVSEWECGATSAFNTVCLDANPLLRKSSCRYVATQMACNLAPGDFQPAAAQHEIGQGQTALL